MLLGPGDEVEIRVFRHPEFDCTATVEQDGGLPHPALGRLPAGGRTPEELLREVTERLREFLRHPRASVNVRVVRSRKIVVLGEVNRPGVFPVREPVSLAEALALAGGFRREARQTEVVLVRPGERKPFVLDLRAALRRGDFAQDVAVYPGDVVFVPESRITNWDRFFMHLDLAVRSILGVGWIYTVAD